MANREACELYIEQEIKSALEEGKKPWTIGKELAAWIEKLFEVTINPHTITKRAQRIEEKENRTNVLKKSKPIETIEYSTDPNNSNSGRLTGNLVRPLCKCGKPAERYSAKGLTGYRKVCNKCRRNKKIANEGKCIQNNEKVIEAWEKIEKQLSEFVKFVTDNNYGDPPIHIKRKIEAHMKTLDVVFNL